MAKNFASVLESLRAAGQDRAQEIDGVYALSCEWLLEQIKHTQARLAAAATSAQATARSDVEQHVRLNLFWAVCIGD